MIGAVPEVGYGVSIPNPQATSGEKRVDSSGEAHTRRMSASSSDVSIRCPPDENAVTCSEAAATEPLIPPNATPFEYVSPARTLPLLGRFVVLILRRTPSQVPLLSLTRTLWRSSEGIKIASNSSHSPRSLAKIAAALFEPVAVALDATAPAHLNE
jgi:hypothetical protein